MILFKNTLFYDHKLNVLVFFVLETLMTIFHYFLIFYTPEQLIIIKKISCRLIHNKSHNP